MMRLTVTITLLFIMLGAAAQTPGLILKGKVTDKESGQPLAGISVYINNSTFSTQTDGNGWFELNNIPFTRVELRFSAINYQMEALQLGEQDFSRDIHIHLLKNTTTLSEVVITAPLDNNSWELYGSTFKTDFLSYSSFSALCDILNPRVLRFRNIKNTNTLKALAREPLLIRNKALGYEITYWLEEYEHRFGPELVLFKGFTRFTEMKGNTKQQKQWKENRKTAYNGSLGHFLKAVYDNKTTDEGFIVNLLKTINYKDLNLYIPFATDSLNTGNAKQLSGFASQFYSKEDSIQYFLQKLKHWMNTTPNDTPLIINTRLPDGKYQACFLVKNNDNKQQLFAYTYHLSEPGQWNLVDWKNAGAIIPDEGEISRIRNQQHLSSQQKEGMKIKLFFANPLRTEDFVQRKEGVAGLQFTESWQVTYTREPTEKEYIRATNFSNKNTGMQYSVLSMRSGPPVDIMANGYYTDAYSLIKGAYWSYEKLDKLLPVNYIPE